jgi:hypothetical protein
MAITTAHKLLTDSWTGDVEFVETAVRRFRKEHVPGNDCHIVLFEILRDSHLHVNVIHSYQTKSVPGWAGPAKLPQGYVHNRAFSEAQSTERIVGHIREMIFAAAA